MRLLNEAARSCWNLFIFSGYFSLHFLEYESEAKIVSSSFIRDFTFRELKWGTRRVKQRRKERESEKAVRWSFCSGTRLLKNWLLPEQPIGLKRRKSLFTILSFSLVKCSPHLFLNPSHFRLHISSHWSSSEGSAGKPWGESWDPGKAELKQFKAGCQELVISVATGIRTGWGWEHLKLCIRGSDTVSKLYLSHRDQLICYVHRIDFLDSKTKLGPSNMFSWSPSLTLL